MLSKEMLGSRNTISTCNLHQPVKTSIKQGEENSLRDMFCYC